MRWSTCWSRVLKISFTTLPRYLKCLEVFLGNLAEFVFFSCEKNDGTYHKSRDHPHGWSSGTRMGWAGDPLNLYHQSVTQFMSWFTHLCLRIWIIQNDPSFHNHGSVEKWVYLQYHFPFYFLGDFPLPWLRERVSKIATGDGWTGAWGVLPREEGKGSLLAVLVTFCLNLVNLVKGRRKEEDQNAEGEGWAPEEFQGEVVDGTRWVSRIDIWYKGSFTQFSISFSCETFLEVASIWLYILYILYTNPKSEKYRKMPYCWWTKSCTTWDG